jgi:hypothetical protein
VLSFVALRRLLLLIGHRLVLGSAHVVRLRARIGCAPERECGNTDGENVCMLHDSGLLWWKAYERTAGSSYFPLVASFGDTIDFFGS